MKRLETERLVLRGWQQEDLDAFYAYAKQPEVGPPAGWPPHPNKAMSQTILDSFIAGDETWCIEEKATGGVTGSIGLHQDPKRQGTNGRMLGYVLAREGWGRGLMTEAARAVVAYAFEELGLDVLSVAHFPFNDGSRRGIEKCGFVKEGVLRRAHKRYDGQVFDKVCYSILREDYFEKIKGR